jgi:hypothetical protein
VALFFGRPPPALPPGCCSGRSTARAAGGRGRPQATLAAPRAESLDQGGRGGGLTPVVMATPIVGLDAVRRRLRRREGRPKHSETATKLSRLCADSARHK